MVVAPRARPGRAARQERPVSAKTSSVEPGPVEPPVAGPRPEGWVRVFLAVPATG